MVGYRMGCGSGGVSRPKFQAMYVVQHVVTVRILILPSRASLPAHSFVFLSLSYPILSYPPSSSSGRAPSSSTLVLSLTLRCAYLVYTTSHQTFLTASQSCRFLCFVSSASYRACCVRASFRVSYSCLPHLTSPHLILVFGWAFRAGLGGVHTHIPV